MMRCYILLLLLLLLHNPSSSCSSVLPLCNHHDNSNLLQFKNSFSINTSLYKGWPGLSSCYNKIASWKNGTDCCEWDGVTCDTTSGHVIGLDLSCSMLQGEFRPNSTLFQLTHLQQLNLAANDFSDSPIHPGIGDLVSLTHLNLSCSSFGNHIPSTISRLSKLLSLDLASCNDELRLDESTWSKLIGNTTNLEELILDGVDMSSIRKIPDSIGHLNSLNQLRLRNCQIDGLIPVSFWNLTQLTHLELLGNRLHGEIPSLLSNLKHLTYLDLSSNSFSGHIPDVFANLTKLEILLLGLNSLGGQLPPSLFRLSQLNVLDLSSNSLEGPIPSLSSCKITKFPKFLESIQDLYVLDLSDNQIEGVIPKWFNDKLLYKWKHMQFIDLSLNRLQGNIPIPSYGTYYFSVSKNNFTGGISSTICNASFLNMLILSHNNLTGNIPQCFGSFPLLQVLDLQINNFYGSIPGNFSKNNAFETIKLNGNQLKGPVPQSLAHCTKLQVLDLGDNNIEDVFPSRLEALQELQVLSLRNNKFHGTITSLSMKHPFPKLKIFDVSNNKFSGPLPMQYFQEFQGMMTTLNDNTQADSLEYMSTHANTTSVPYNDSVVIIMKGQEREMSRILTIFTTIDLSNNLFEGKIPQILGELNFLKGLNLSHNKISGNIPQTLGNLTSLEWLDLSWNRLKGEIPMSLTNLNFLSVLNLSKNQLEGVIPTGKQFNTFQNDSYRGNPMLCEFPLSKSCGNGEEQAPSVFAEAKESLFGWKSVVVGYACGVVFGTFLGSLFIKTAKPLWLARLICGYT
ncbi:hypothetical protein AAHE18_17G060500 [Arachis hypogaea]